VCEWKSNVLKRHHHSHRQKHCIIKPRKKIRQFLFAKGNTEFTTHTPRVNLCLKKIDRKEKEEKVNDNRNSVNRDTQ
jgi:hypothetical protein